MGSALWQPHSTPSSPSLGFWPGLSQSPFSHPYGGPRVSEPRGTRVALTGMRHGIQACGCLLLGGWLCKQEAENAEAWSLVRGEWKEKSWQAVLARFRSSQGTGGRGGREWRIEDGQMWVPHRSHHSGPLLPEQPASEAWSHKDSFLSHREETQIRGDMSLIQDHTAAGTSKQTCIATTPHKVKECARGPLRPFQSCSSFSSFSLSSTPARHSSIKCVSLDSQSMP